MTVTRSRAEAFLRAVGLKRMNVNKVTMTTSSEIDSGVTTQDLAACVNLIDVCSRRGAFQGSELEAVGQLRKKLAKILEAHAPPQPPDSDEGAVPATTSDTPEAPEPLPKPDAPKKRRKGKGTA